MGRRIAKHRQSSVPAGRAPLDWHAPAALVAVMLGIALVVALAGEPVRAFLMLDPEAVRAGQGWRLLTTHHVHLNLPHLFLNVAALTLYVALGARHIGALDWLLRLLVLSLGVSLAMWWWLPPNGRYAGFSGIAHGLFVLGLWPLARDGDRVAMLALAVVAAKLAWETWAGAAAATSAWIGGRVAVEAHLAGAMTALLYGLLHEWRK